MSEDSSVQNRTGSRVSWYFDSELTALGFDVFTEVYEVGLPVRYWGIEIGKPKGELASFKWEASLTIWKRRFMVAKLTKTRIEQIRSDRYLDELEEQGYFNNWEE